jgi:Putative auto-transporter adhesin, head GIN domain
MAYFRTGLVSFSRLPSSASNGKVGRVASVVSAAPDDSGGVDPIGREVNGESPQAGRLPAPRSGRAARARGGAQGSGASNLELADLHLQDLDIKLSGASHGNVNVTGTITAQVSGACNLAYTGTPQFTKRDTSGGSSIQPG